MHAALAKQRISRGTWQVLHSFAYTIRDVGPSGILRYIALVEATFDMFPCCMCRAHIEEHRVEWMRDLIDRVDRCIPARATVLAPAGSTSREALEAARLAQLLLIIDEIVLWAFRVHNSVTRLVKRGATNEYIEMESRGNEDDILHALDRRFNIVYDRCASV
jgi:hypothetical protein